MYVFSEKCRGSKPISRREWEAEGKYCSFKFFNLGESYEAESGFWSQDWKQTKDAKRFSVQRTNTGTVECVFWDHLKRIIVSLEDPSLWKEKLIELGLISVRIIPIIGVHQITVKDINAF